ncbi:hypothetical protein C8Q78DRAFT_986958 [Trametes maxima]|nr:hypothetical protein C8Q78DRAFT_986958 [Trametes maxima]
MMLAPRVFAFLTLCSLVCVSAVPSKLHLELDVEISDSNTPGKLNILAQIEDDYLGSGLIVGEEAMETMLPNFINCDGQQRTGIIRATEEAGRHIQSAQNALRGDPRVLLPRYTQWFGEYSASRAAQVAGCYSWLNGGNKFDAWTYLCQPVCGGDAGQLHNGASVNPQRISYDLYRALPDPINYPPPRPNVIEVCPRFFTLPIFGTKSMGSVLVREASRFNHLCGTREEPFTPEDCRNVARVNPDQAIKNAGSYEFFASNYQFPTN